MKGRVGEPIGPTVSDICKESTAIALYVSRTKANVGAICEGTRTLSYGTGGFVKGRMNGADGYVSCAGTKKEAQPQWRTEPEKGHGESTKEETEKKLKG